ncbi:MAG: DUF1549 and DUF1553 domain-containing protein [Gemmataceae bacterium]|nr:DUF1549 and DUF1553 domain-containing protein [Gemmataceae bacterium]MDW8264436.1 DUF1549 and DUF1553 domain-containing protein [Gemmataceae bacterium]
MTARNDNGRLFPLAYGALCVMALASGAEAAPEKGAKASPATPSQAGLPNTKVDAASLARWIDAEIQKALDAEKVPASPLADDAEFVRRVSLDITGIVPTADEAAAFIDDPDPAKRAKLIDRLLASPAYGRHMADLWVGWLLPRTSETRLVRHEPMVRFLEENFNKNKPWNEFVTEIITASGPQDENPAVTFFLFNDTVDKVTDNVARHFLGIQLQCAQCHNHPFTGWQQTEYWGMAAFFMKVQRQDNRNKALRNGAVPGVAENLSGRAGRRNNLPESAKIVPAKFLQGEEPKLNPNEPFRPVLARWLTSPQNPFFARAMVNRLWHQFFGRGLVNPVDDMHAENQPSHPALLEGLAEQFARDFDVKDLIRAICNSQAYQRTSRPLPENVDDTSLFSHMAIKALSPEQLYDSLVRVVGTATEQRGNRVRSNTTVRGNQSPREVFAAFFRVEETEPTEYTAGIPQALRLMNAPMLNNTAAALASLVKSDDPNAVIERLYLATVSRRPRAEELTRLAAYVHNAGNRQQAYGDILWALLNSSEFALNH